MRGGDELVLVDDGSRDASAAIAASHDGPGVIHVTTPGLGIVDALRRGLEVCRGGLIARMDADDVSLPGRFGAQRALLEREPGLAAVAVRVELFGAPGAGME